MKTLIIGGGASGLYLGSLLSGSTVLERSRPGQKLLLTGGGRCNYTHSGSVEDLLGHYNGNRQFIKRVLYQHQPEDITRYLGELGIRTKEEAGGQRYPASDRAGDIAEALSSRCSLLFGKALGIEKHEGRFIVRTEDAVLDADSVVLATGGMAYPMTGSDGNGYRLAESLGHTVEKPRPALSPLSLSENLSRAEGMSLKATLRTGKKEKTGDILITRDGLSGPAALNLSREFPGDLTVSFLGDADLSQAAKLVKNALPIPPRLSEALLGSLSEKKCGNLSKADKSTIISRLTRFSAHAAPVEKNAMVSRGGVSTKEINAMTMESKLVKGLYFTGELVDVDADTGGYNLTWAFASAYAVYKALKPGKE